MSGYVRICQPGWFFPEPWPVASTSDSFTVSASSRSWPYPNCWKPIKTAYSCQQAAYGLSTRLNDLYLCLSLRLSLLRVYHIESYLSMLSPSMMPRCCIHSVHSSVLDKNTHPVLSPSPDGFSYAFWNQASNAIKPYGQSISCRSPLCPLNPSIISDRPGSVRKQQKTWKFTA